MFACLAFGKCSNWIQLVGCTSSRLNLPSPQTQGGVGWVPKRLLRCQKKSPQMQTREGAILASFDSLPRPALELRMSGQEPQASVVRLTPMVPHNFLGYSYDCLPHTLLGPSFISSPMLLT